MYENSPFYSKTIVLVDSYKKVAIPTAQDITISTSNAEELNKYVNQNKSGLGEEFPKRYPNLNAKLKKKPSISAAETSKMMRDNSLSQESFITSMRSSAMLVSLESFYSPRVFESSGTASFCSIAPNIFSQFQRARDVFNDVKGYVDDYENVLSQINDNPSKFIVDQLKDQMNNVVDQMAREVKHRVSLLNSLFTNESSYNYNQNGIRSRVVEERTKADNAVSDTAIDRLKDTLTGALTFTASNFEKLDMDQAEFMVLRFCELMGNVESLLFDVTRPMTDLMENYQNSLTILRGSGELNSARAIAAGASRLLAAQRNSGILRTSELPARGGPASAYLSTSGSNSGPSPYRGSPASVAAITAEEADEIANDLSYESVRSGRSRNVDYRPGPASASLGNFGWDNVRPLEKVMLLRLSKHIGRKIIVLSAWRSVEVQAAIRAGNESSIPKSGYHQSGQAFDIMTSNLPSKEAFTYAARFEGFGPVRYYDSQGFVHIDSGPVRTW